MFSAYISLALAFVFVVGLFFAFVCLFVVILIIVSERKNRSDNTLITYSGKAGTGV